MEEELQTPVAIGGNKAKINEQSTIVTDNSFVEFLRPYLGEDDIADGAHIRSRLLDGDESYINNVAARIVAEMQPNETYYQGREEEHMKHFTQVKSTIQNILINETHTGETVKEAIVKRSAQLQKNDAGNPIPLASYKNLMKDNYKEFQDTGFFDENKNIIADDRLLINRIQNNEEFLNKVTSYNYDKYLDVLTKSHNIGGVDVENVNDMATGYAIYEQFGSEGLTHYINWLQRPEIVEGEKPPAKVQEALQFMNTAKKDGKTVFDYVTDFYGSEESDLGQFEINPLRSSIELKQRPPRDANAFTNMFYRTDNEDDAAKYFISSIRLNKDVSTFDRFAHDRTESPKGSTLIGDIYRVFKSATKYYDPLSLPTYWDSSEETILEDIKDGVEGYNYRFFRNDIITQAEKGELFTVNDLMKTVALNGRREETENGQQYILNYESLDVKTRIALDSLMFSDNYRSMFRERGDEIIFQPNIGEVFQNSAITKIFGNISTEPVVVRDANGNFLGIDEKPSTSLIPQIWDTIGSFGWEGSKVIVNTIGEITAFDRLMEDVVIPKLDQFGFEDTSYKIQDWYESAQVPFQVQVERDGFGANAGGMLGVLAGYVYTAGRAGGAGFKAIKNTIELSKKARKVTNLSNASLFLKGKTGTTLAHVANKVISTAPPAALKSSIWGAKITLGEGILGALAPENHAVSQVGFDVLNQYTDISTDEAKQRYETSNRLVQAGADFLINESVAIIFDNLMGVGRYGKGKLTGKAKGSTINEAGTDFLINIGRGNQEFTTEYGRIKKWLLDDLASKPIGDIKESMLRTADGFIIRESPENIDTYADFALGFMDEAGEFMKDLKPTIRNTVEFYDNQLGLNKRTSEQLDDVSQELYDGVIGEIGKQISGILTGGTSKESRRFALDFADLLMSDAPVFKKLAYTTKNGTQQYEMSFIEAQQIAQNNPFAVIKQIPSGQYTVGLVDGSYWTLDLAKSVKDNFINNTAEGTFNNYLSRRGLDNASQELISSERAKFNKFYGKQVEVEEGVYGRVVDIDKDGYVVATSDGRVVTTEAPIMFKEGLDDTSVKRTVKETNETEVALNRLQKQTESATELQTIPDEIVVPKDDKTFKKVGMLESFWNKVNTHAGYKTKKPSTARSIIKAIGTDGNVDYNIIKANKAEISIYDASRVPDKGLPTNTIVQTKSGNQTNHFITNLKTKKNIPPSVWITDGNGKFVRNENWSRIDKNKTFKEDGTPVFYVAEQIDGETWYRPSKNGRGKILNIQQPTINLDINANTILKDNIDGFYKEVNGTEYYKPLSEADQVIDLTDIKGTRPTPNIEVKSKNLFDQANPIKEEVAEEIGNALKINLFPPQLVGAVAGAFASQFVATEDNSVNPIPWMALGALLGTKRIYRPINTWIKGAAEVATHPFPKNASRQIAASKRLEAQQGLTAVGASDGSFDINTVRDMDEFVDDIAQVSSNPIGNWARATKQIVIENKFFQSSIGFLQKLGIKEADVVSDHLVGIGNSISEIVVRGSKNFEENIYRRKMREYMNGVEVDGQVVKLSEKEAKTKSLQESRNYHDYYETQGALSDFDAALKEIGLDYPDEGVGFFARIEQGLGMTPQVSKSKTNYFNEAYARIMHAGFNKPSEVLPQFVDNVTVSRAYANNPDLIRLDEALLKRQDFVDFISAHRKAYNEELTQYVKTLDDQAAQALKKLRLSQQGGAYTEGQVRMFEDFYNSGLSKSEFRKELSLEKKKTFDQLSHRDNFTDIVEVVVAKNKMTDLKGKYLPQMIDRNRWIADQKEFIKREGLENLSNRQKDEAYSKYMSDKIFNMNISDDAKKTLQQYNEADQSLETRKFNNKGQAIAEMTRIANTYANNPETAAEGLEALGRVEQFVKEVTVDGKTKYFLEVPSDEFKLLDLESKHQARRLFEDLKNGALIQHSNYLENPRIRNLPLEIIEVDPFKLREKYAYDVGRRLHSRKAGVYNSKYLQEKFLTPIYNKLRARGVENASQHMNRVENIWNTMYGMLGKNAGEIKSEMNSQKFSNTISKLLFSVWGFGFGKYNMFEWAVVAPQISSWSSVKNTVQLYGTDTKALKNMEDFLLNENIIRKQIGAFKPEFEALAVSEATGRDVLTWVDNKANRWANLAGNFSVGKVVANAFGADISGAGLARLIPVIGDSFIGGNIVSTAINARAALGEANQLAKIRQALTAGEEIAENLLPKGVNKNKYTLPEVDRLLKNLGVNDPETFMTNAKKFEEGVNRLDASENFTNEMLDQNPQHYEDIRNVISYSTQSFHGTNRMFRPESWSTSWGRLMSTYLTYGQNIARQVVNQRMYQPLRSWRVKHQPDMGYINAMDLTLNKRRGNYKYLQDKYGLTQEAIEEFPDHVSGAFIKAGLSVGVSFAGYLSVGAIQDLLSFPFVQDEYQWYQTRRNITLNPFAKEDEQMTLGDAFGSLDEFKTWYELAEYGLANIARTGYFGALSSPIESTARGGNIVDRDGVMTVLPLPSLANEAFKGMVNTVIRPAEVDMSGAPKAILDWTPIFGSSYFTDVKRSWFSEPNKKKFKIRSTLGEDIDFESINFNAQL